MAHWSDRYVGRPYVEGSFDCGALAELVQREVFAKEIHLPSERRYVGKRDVERFQAMASQIAAEKVNFAEPVTVPRDGDAVLLMARGYPQHIGVFCMLQGEPWVMHAADSCGQVVRCRIRDLASRCLAVEGYYRWI
jgi:hypothetical protein